VKTSKYWKERVDRDWRAIDYAVFGKPVTMKTFGEDFVTEWATLKTELLKGFYENIGSLVKPDCCEIEDVEEDARTIGRKVRKLAILRLLESKKEVRPLVTKLVKEVFASKDSAEEAVRRSTKVLIAHEALANLVGGSNKTIKEMINLLVRYYKSR